MKIVRVQQDRFPVGSYHGQRQPGYRVANLTAQNLEYIRAQVMVKKSDWVFCIDGRPGSGKTTLALQLAMYLDPSFELSRVVFTPEQFLEALKTATKGQAVIFDEAYVVGARNALTEFNKKVIEIMSQIRSRNLYIFFVLPALFDLDRTLALHRIDTLFHCYKDDYGNRGKYSVYFQKKVKGLYLNGKKFYSYAKPDPNFFTNFSACFVLDEDLYEKKKQTAIKGINVRKLTKLSKRWFYQRNNLVKFVYSNMKISQDKIAQITKDLSRTDIEEILDDKIGLVEDNAPEY